MLNDNNALVQAIAGFVALLTPTQTVSAITFKSELMATLSATSLVCDDIMLFESALSEAQLQSIATASGMSLQ